LKKITDAKEIQEEIKLIIIRNEIEKRESENEVSASDISDISVSDIPSSPIVEYSNTDVLKAPVMSSDEGMYIYGNIYMYISIYIHMCI
jgi:hypothetical protein